MNRFKFCILFITLPISYGCFNRQTPPLVKQVLQVKGDIQVVSCQTNSSEKLDSGKVLSNKDVLDLSDSARCVLIPGRDTIIARGPGRLNVSSARSGNRTIIKIVMAHGRLLLRDDPKNPIDRLFLVSTSQMQGEAGPGSYVIESDSGHTHASTFSGKLLVRSKATQESMVLEPNYSVVIDTSRDKPILHELLAVDKENYQRYFKERLPVQQLDPPVIQNHSPIVSAETKEREEVSPKKGVLKASAGHNVSAKVGQRIPFDGKGFGDQVLRYEWDFDNDGNVDFKSDLTGKAEYVYSVPGVYNAVLQVFFQGEKMVQSTLRVIIK